MSLDETWASTNFVRFDYCTAAFIGGQPHALTRAEHAIATDAARNLPNESLTAIFLDVLGSCARIPPGEGPHGVASHPAPILKAALQLCPHAPQSALIRQQLKQAEG
jgi:hypothetical protein